MMARYEFIDAEKATKNPDGTRRYTIKQMCRWMKVSTSGYYEWLSRPASATAQWRERLKPLIIKAFTDADSRYGYRRVHEQLARWGQLCDREVVRDLMRELGLVACQPKRSRRGTTKQAAKRADIPDLVNRDFTADKPGAKLVGDITYIHTWEGWVYLAMVIDCFSRKIVGWAMADTTRLRSSRRPSAWPPGISPCRLERFSIPTAGRITRPRSSPRPSKILASYNRWVVPGFALITPWRNRRTERSRSSSSRGISHAGVRGEGGCAVHRTVLQFS